MLTYLQFKKYIYIKKIFTFANLLMEKPSIDLIHLAFLLATSL